MVMVMVAVVGIFISLMILMLMSMMGRRLGIKQWDVFANAKVEKKMATSTIIAMLISLIIMSSKDNYTEGGFGY